MVETPSVKQLHDRQKRLIERVQNRLAENFENGGADQKAQALARTLLDLTVALGKLDSQLHPATKVQR